MPSNIGERPWVKKEVSDMEIMSGSTNEQAHKSWRQGQSLVCPGLCMCLFKFNCYEINNFN